MNFSTSFKVDTDQSSIWVRVYAFFKAHEFNRSGDFFQRGVPGFSFNERPGKRQCLAAVNVVPDNDKTAISVDLYTDDNFLKPLKMEQNYWNELIADFCAYVSGGTETIPRRSQDTLTKITLSYALLYITGVAILIGVSIAVLLLIFIFFDAQSDFTLFPILAYLFSILIIALVLHFRWEEKSNNWLEDRKRYLLRISERVTDRAKSVEETDFIPIFISYGMLVAFTFRQFSQKKLIIKSTSDLVTIVVLNFLAVLYLLFLFYGINLKVQSQAIQGSWQYYVGIVIQLVIFMGFVWLQNILSRNPVSWKLNVAKYLLVPMNITMIALAGWGLSALFDFSQDTYLSYVLVFPVLSSVIFWITILGRYLVKRFKSKQ